MVKLNCHIDKFLEFIILIYLRFNLELILEKLMFDCHKFLDFINVSTS